LNLASPFGIFLIPPFTFPSMVATIRFRSIVLPWAMAYLEREQEDTYE
jgi:hypothetical protein